MYLINILNNTIIETQTCLKTYKYILKYLQNEGYLLAILGINTIALVRNGDVFGRFGHFVNNDGCTHFIYDFRACGFKKS